jgi:hypothetical protein
MAKRRTKDEGGGTAVADPPAAEATSPAPVAADSTPPMSAAEVEAIKKELEEAKRALRLLEKRNKRIIDAEKSVESWKRELDRLTESINETRKSWKDSVEKLQREIKRQEAQNELPFDGAKAATPAAAPAAPAPAANTDTSGATKLEGLAGLSESLVAKLAGVDVTTIAELEAYMDAGKFVPGRVKGLGEAAINKISDALMAFRKSNPKDGADDRPKRCGKPECKAEYPGELTACPTCGETVHERVDPEPTPPEVAAAEAAKPEVTGDAPATDGAQGSAVVTEATSAPTEAGTVFDPTSGGGSQ